MTGLKVKTYLIRRAGGQADRAGGHRDAPPSEKPGDHAVLRAPGVTSLTGKWSGDQVQLPG